MSLTCFHLIQGGVGGLVGRKALCCASFKNTSKEKIKKEKNGLKYF